MKALVILLVCVTAFSALFAALGSRTPAGPCAKEMEQLARQYGAPDTVIVVENTPSRHVERWEQTTRDSSGITRIFTVFYWGSDLVLSGCSMERR